MVENLYDPETAKQFRVFPHFQSANVYRENPMECLAAILARSLIHGTHVVHQETFLKIYLHRVNRQQLFREIQQVLQQQKANLRL